ncbi:phosphatase PAP2 family protein [Pseudoduganella sp. OTU4001]|uniref:phosphatase PAP2 family protein n=1 Tax=Pseudoduganella sp. OTU4001 TaxID=3043854 RepID=UPI00313DAACF
MSAVLTTPSAARSALLRKLYAEHAVLIAVVALHFSLALALAWAFPEKYHQNLGLGGYLGSLAMGLVFALCGYTIYVMLFKRPARLVHYLYQNLRAYLSVERLLFALPVLALIPLFATSFTVVKAAVPMFQPFAWDARLAAADAWLHFGRQPWEWLQPVFGHPVMTAIVNYNYHLWFFIMLSCVYWLAFNMERRTLRMQFLLSFVVSWIVLGNVVALMFSSVGPCFYGFVVPGADPFAAQLAALREADQSIPVLALQVQDMLWNDFNTHAGTNALSIAAMPSMHVGTAVLLALLGWRLNRAAGIALTVFAMLVMIGSVHLAWHYALDGYAGGLGAWIIWHACGRIVQRSAP